MMYRLLVTAVVLYFSIDLALNGPIIFPPKIKFEERPICSSFDSLCGLDYRYVTEDDIPVQLLHSENDICRCPGNETCPTAYEWENTTNSIVQKLYTRMRHGLVVKIGYCRFPEAPKKPCGFTDSVLTSRGRGLFKFEIMGDILCNCNRPLVQKSAWIEQVYDYAVYGCGQPKCSKRNTSICSEISLRGGTLRSEYLCRCRRNEVCNGTLPLTEGQSVQHSCHLM